MNALPEESFGEKAAGANYVIRPGAYGLAEADGQILLVAGAHGRWFLPGGGLEPGEAPEAGLAREIREELGVDALVQPPFARAIQYIYAETEQTHFEIRASYHRISVPTVTSLTGEHKSDSLPPREALRRLHRAADGWAVETYFRLYRR